MKNFLPKLNSSFLRPLPSFPVGSIVIAATVILIGIINFKSGTVLTGWDNLHPEFALDVNIKRSIFAVWQEYQGLGLLGGMGHASDLVRQIMLWPLVQLLPLGTVRYIATMATLLAGALGTYFLVKNVLLPYEKNREVVSTIAGLFYAFNIATIQTYYVAFEAFTSHYAALPWLLLGALLYIKNNTKKYFFIFLLIVLLATPAGYIPTLFVAFLIALSLILAGILLFAPNRKQTFFRSLKAFAIIFAVNAFWLLPFLYFTLTSSQVNLNAKMNQMATETIFLQNKEFGDLLSVVMLKGFWFSNVDPDLSGNFRHMLSVWISHFQNPWVIGTSLGSFAVIIIGIIATLKARRPLHLAFLLLFIFAFTMLATDTPVFSFFVDLFRKLPLFGQAFRFPFTKFSILATLLYSIFFAFGVVFLVELTKRYLRRFAIVLISLVALGLILLPSYPVFQGRLFYEKELIKLPDEYTKTFEFFKNQNPNQRIANFPQHTFWGWNFYTWGYGGSGFLWYGIKQPILDRAFDVWSDELENYYYEISNALYAKDPTKVAQVLNKYQVNWLLIDRSVYSPFAPKAVHIEETEQLLQQIPTVKKVQEFGSVSIYSVDLLNDPHNFVYTTPILPKVNKYSWNNDDTAYQKYGNYASGPVSNVHLPFRSLFSYRSQNDLEYVTKITGESITFTSQLPAINSPQTIHLPLYTQSQELIPVELYSEERGEEIYLIARLLTPEITVNRTTITKPSTSVPLFILPKTLAGNYSLDINGYKQYSLDLARPVSQKTFLTLMQDNVMVLRSQQTGEIQTNILPASYITSTVNTLPTVYQVTPQDSKTLLSVTIPRVIDGYFGHMFEGDDFAKPADCNTFRNGKTSSGVTGKSIVLESTNDTVCTYVSIPNLPHSSSFLLTIKSTNERGRPLHFWTQNLDQHYAPVDTYLPRGEATSTIALSPMEQFGQGYSFHFENVSIGNQTAKNSITSLEVVPFPYRYLKSISIGALPQIEDPNVSFEVDHPNESYYRLSRIQTNNTPFTIVLSQSYDKGWSAYVIEDSRQQSIVNSLKRFFPFLFGREIKTHLIVNNWSNGWEIENPQILAGKEIIIVYTPQYLQLAGFLLAALPFLFLFGNVFRKIANFYHKFNYYFEVKTVNIKNKMLM